jgi:DNA-binding response OmpR family regulator
MGSHCVKRLRSDNRTSHIPVILLSARVSNSQKLEGLEAGAEDYITKPFNYEILELKMQASDRVSTKFSEGVCTKI